MRKGGSIEGNSRLWIWHW